ncbi:hypothetical protein EDD11_004745 [Mortierella claussenii]|nr:hypothetical protein EDD11_004745 [Mortierella claussenii]
MRPHRSPLRTSALALAMVALSALAQSDPSPPIQASIFTPWAAPPLLLEILEAVAVENKTSYYPLMRQLTDTGFLDSLVSPKDLYDKSLDIIQSHGHLQPHAISTLKWSLAMHTTAPWIEAHYHLYNSTIVPDRTSKGAFDPSCGVWVDWYDRQVCTVTALESIVASGLGQYKEKARSKPSTMDLDHVQSSQSDPSLFTILYADIYDPEFAQFRHYLDKLATDHGLSYSIRYRPPTNDTEHSSLPLAGYGVELALKSTDYIVIDDRDLGHGDDSGATGQTVFKATADHSLFGDEVPAVEPVSEQDLGTLDQVTAQLVLQSENPLKTLVSVAQDFPKYQRKLSKIALNKTLSSAFDRNMMTTRGDLSPKVWLNNQLVPHHKMNPFNLIRLIRREREALVSFATIGVSSKKAVDLLTDFSTEDTSGLGLEPPTGVFDVRDKSEEKNLIVWLNDLESDQRYKEWNPTLMGLFQPKGYGQFHQVRKNIINSLFVLDLSTPQSLELLAFEISNFVQRLVPFRFGVIPLIKSEDGEGQDIPSASRKSYSSVTGMPKLKNTEVPELTYDEVIAKDSVYRPWLKSVRAMNDRIGITGPSHFVNGKYFAWNEDHAKHLMMETPQQTAFLATCVQRGELSDNDNVYDYLMTLPSAHSRRNPYIFDSDDSPIKIVDLVQGEERPFIDTLSYITNGDSTDQKATVILVSDFDSKEGLPIALEALKFLDSEEQTARIAFVHNGHISKESLPSLGNFVRQSSVDGKPLPIGFWKDLLQEIARGRTFASSFANASNRHREIAAIGFEGSKGLEEHSDRARRHFLQEIVKAKEGSTHIVVNARAIGPIHDAFSTADFKVLVDYESIRRIDKVKRVLKGTQIQASASNIMKASSILLNSGQQLDQGLYDLNQPVVPRGRFFEILDSEHAGFTVNPTFSVGNENALFRFTAVLTPASELTQRWAPILLALSQMDQVQVDIVLMPDLHVREVPIKRFYRYVVEPELKFDDNGALAPANAYFAGIPEPTLLTLGVDVNPAWVVTSKVCIHDLDNLKLSSLTGSARSTGVQAEFELRHILIEGFARDLTQQTPPKGAQFILGTKSEPHVADTLVMANMGYFQLKANPGVWEMVLRPGRTTEVFSIESIGTEGWVVGAGLKNDKRDLVIANFEGLVLYPRLIRNPGMERANIQDESVQSSSGLWDSIKTTFKGFAGTGAKAPAKKAADINIFSVASGHLYERFLSIMILSVIKNTQSTVKFWFIENFLSPSFKDFIPHMAEKYGFEYELVTYNWPHWLRAQTEKQRIIWAYKILFLDVLFPLDLDKIIFVDADQIVRTDMQELVDLDLHGAPYGYTPMCQDRKEMEGFRFWNQGYWRDHLRGKPYHISALYVVDLVKFRQMQAGDRLRNHYQQLTRDPGSLANLDQDLPNNMQNEVPIFSLPQEWLWCETWCGDEGLDKAKTIDLCNNPLTKEPKLDRARRQIKEWESLDNEATEFAKKVNAGLKAARRQPSHSEERAADRVHPPNPIEEQQPPVKTLEDIHATKDEL